MSEGPEEDGAKQDTQDGEGAACRRGESGAGAAGRRTGGLGRGGLNVEPHVRPGPGAFVGAIFGGASPLEAGRFQVVVLASIMAAGSITAVALIRSLGNVKVRPKPL